MTPQERAAAIYTALAGNRPLVFTLDGVTIRADGFAVDGPAITCTVVSATKNGQDLPLDNPYTFVNPPIMAPDGGTRQMPVNSRGGTRNITVPTYQRNELASMRRILYEAVVYVASRNGWTG